MVKLIFPLWEDYYANNELPEEDCDTMEDWGSSGDDYEGNFKEIYS